MSVLIVGSTALDSIKTPKAENPRLLGGSASHSAVAASFFSQVKLVGVVGDDFPKQYIRLYKRHKSDLQGLQILPGNTFHWSGEYEVNMDNRRTLLTALGLFVTPAYPLEHVVDPTGAGDSFVGGMVGYLASKPGPIERNLRRGMVCGSVIASFCCEGFGLSRTTKLTRAQIEKRVKELQQV